jgi:hypothetical protein
MARKKYYFNDFTDRLICECYDGTTVAIDQLATSLNLPRWVVKRRAQMLGLARIKEKPWSPEEVDYLEANYHRLSILTLTRKLKRSTTAISLKAKRLGIRKFDEGYTACSLSQALGVDSHKVSRWVELGLIKASRRHTAREADVYLITDRAVREFMLNYPTELDLRRADPVWLVDVLGRA